MAKTSEKLRYVLGWLAEASIERRELLGLLRKLHAKVDNMSSTQDTVQSIIHDLQATMENQTTVIGGFQAFLSAHDAALAKTIQDQLNAGASADIVAPLQALRDGYKANTDQLTASLVNRTPADPANAAPSAAGSNSPLLPPDTSSTAGAAPATDQAAGAAGAAVVTGEGVDSGAAAGASGDASQAGSIFGQATGNAGNQ